MTGRERLNAVLKKQPKDRLSWTTLVDNSTLLLLPAGLRGNGGIDFYKHLGCDIFLLNGWNTPFRFTSPSHHWPEEVEVEKEQEGQRTTVRWKTPKGVLAGIFEGVHPVKYPVDSISAVNIYREMWEGSSFTAHDDSITFAGLNSLIGESGVVTRFWGPSTIPRLLENDMGVENFYYLLADHPEDVQALIQTMHEREADAFKILAEGPWDSVTLVENTSTYYISPDIYRRYNMPHQREFVDAVKSKGKTAILHMCGHIRGILDLVKETRCDGIHTLTPPPTGNTPWEDVLDILGDDLIIFGCLDPTIFVAGDIGRIPLALNTLITPRLREANFVLNPMADGIPVEPERFTAVRDWIQKNANPTG
ncbi:MAG: uroporphyrinogen decarboxylase family protein [Candidatus Latescibacterota bacterium]